jgi:PKD repeat protein
VSLTVTSATGSDTRTKYDYIVVTVPPALVADFTASPTSGPAALTVSFSDASTGIVETWSWNFGDGGTSSEENPTHAYNITGSYTVTLTVTGPDGIDTEIKTDYITVTDPGSVTVDFSASPVSGTAPLDVQFTDLSVGAITAWTWDFGDGGFLSTERNPQHTYTSSGVYTVTLTVTTGTGPQSETKVGYINVSAGGGAPKKDSGGGCSCSIDRSPTPLTSLLGYFLPVVMLMGAYLALRRRQ